MNQVLKLGSRGADVVNLQQLLNQKIAPSPMLRPDGDFGPRTDRTVRAYQKAKGLLVDGVVGPRTLQALRTQNSVFIAATQSAPGTWPMGGLPPASAGAKLNDSDFERAAQKLDCEIACVRAVAAVESGGAGFLPSGKPKILFEAHIFSKQTGGKYNSSHPNISSPSWNKSLYGASGEHQFDRLNEAMVLDHKAALNSASWGMFQIMGFNHSAAGYSSVTQFVDAMYKSEGKHLDALVSFLITKQLDKALREKRWADFAKGYNGAGYAANKYDIKLKEAYDKFSKK